jgi:hypothetical protein
MKSKPVFAVTVKPWSVKTLGSHPQKLARRQQGSSGKEDDYPH